MSEKKKKLAALWQAVQQNDAAKVTETVSGLDLSYEAGYSNACATALQHGQSGILETLLQAGYGFQFVSKFSGEKQREENERLARQLIKDAYGSPDAAALLPVLYKGNGTYGILNMQDFLNENSPVELIEACLKNKNAYSSFTTCIQNAGLLSTPALDFILTFSSEHDDADVAMARALITVAEKGDVDKAALLLAHGADPDFEGAEAFRKAAENGNQEIVDLFLPYVSLEEYGEKVATQLEYKNASPEIIQSIEAAIRRVGQKPADKTVAMAKPFAASQLQDDRFQLLDNSTMFEVQKMPDGSTLTTLFNFASRQQKNLLIRENEMSSPSMVIVSFDDLDGGVVDTLQKKFEALAKPAATEPPTTAESARRVNQFKSVLG